MHKNSFILEPKNGRADCLFWCVPHSKVIFNTRLGNYIAFVAWINSVWNLVSRLKAYLFYLGHFCHVFSQLSDFSVTSHLSAKSRKKTHSNCHIWAEFHDRTAEWWIIKQILNILSGVYRTCRTFHSHASTLGWFHLLWVAQPFNFQNSPENVMKSVSSSKFNISLYFRHELSD